MSKDSLIDRRLILMVSDPWDFGTEVGCGPFEVVVHGVHEEYLLLRVLRPWKHQGVVWEYLVASGRPEPILTLLTGKKIGANAIRTTLEQINADPETFGAKFYRGQYSMLTGSLQLIIEDIMEMRPKEVKDPIGSPI